MQSTHSQSRGRGRKSADRSKEQKQTGREKKPCKEVTKGRKSNAQNSRRGQSRRGLPSRGGGHHNRGGGQKSRGGGHQNRGGRQSRGGGHQNRGGRQSRGGRPQSRGGRQQSRGRRQSRGRGTSRGRGQSRGRSPSRRRGRSRGRAQSRGRGSRGRARKRGGNRGKYAWRGGRTGRRSKIQRKRERQHKFKNFVNAASPDYLVAYKIYRLAIKRKLGNYKLALLQHDLGFILKNLLIRLNYIIDERLMMKQVPDLSFIRQKKEVLSKIGRLSHPAAGAILKSGEKKKSYLPKFMRIKAKELLPPIIKVFPPIYDWDPVPDSEAYQDWFLMKWNKNKVQLTESLELGKQSHSDFEQYMKIPPSIEEMLDEYIPSKKKLNGITFIPDVLDAYKNPYIEKSLLSIFRGGFPFGVLVERLMQVYIADHMLNIKEKRDFQEGFLPEGNEVKLHFQNIREQLRVSRKNRKKAGKQHRFHNGQGLLCGFGKSYDYRESILLKPDQEQIYFEDVLDRLYKNTYGFQQSKLIKAQKMRNNFQNGPRSLYAMEIFGSGQRKKSKFEREKSHFLSSWKTSGFGKAVHKRMLARLHKGASNVQDHRKISRGKRIQGRTWSYFRTKKRKIEVCELFKDKNKQNSYFELCLLKSLKLRNKLRNIQILYQFHQVSQSSSQSNMLQYEEVLQYSFNMCGVHNGEVKKYFDKYAELKNIQKDLKSTIDKCTAVEDMLLDNVPKAEAFLKSKGKVSVSEATFFKGYIQWLNGRNGRKYKNKRKFRKIIAERTLVLANFMEHQRN